MSRVVMFVFNDVTTDARVLREAGSLTAAGHEVTIMARSRDLAITEEEVEARKDFEIVRVPVPGEWRAWWIAASAPWRAWTYAVATLKTEVRRFPGGWLKLAGLAVAGLLVLPYAAARAGATVARRVRHRPSRAGGGSIEYLGRWAFSTLGWARAAAARAPAADVYHGHDLTGLPGAVFAASRHGGTVVYDSHEVFLESGGHAARGWPIRTLFRRLELRWSRRAAAVVTVNQALAEELERRLRPRRVVVVHNCVPRWSPPSRRPDLIREAAGIPHGAPIALYHGRFTRDRGMEQLADALLEPGMEAVHGVYVGYGPERPEYERLSRDTRYGGRLHVLDAVPPDELIPWVASADVGVVAIQGTSLNHLLSSPNKLFECLAAGVPVVASDFPEMRRIVGDDPDGRLGELCDPHDVPAIAGAIVRIVGAPPEGREALRARCLAAAHARWNWETESQRLLELYDDLATGA